MDTDRKWFKLEPLNIVDKRADSEHYGVYDVLSPKYIVIHATGGVDSVAWLTTRSTPPVSSHRLISRNGTIYKLVPDSRVAWHVGKGIMLPGRQGVLVNANSVCLGIELENLNDGRQDFPMAQMESAVRQVLSWWSEHSYLPILSHASLDTRKRDPVGFDWELLTVMVSRGLSRAFDNVYG